MTLGKSFSHGFTAAFQPGKQYQSQRACVRLHSFGRDFWIKVVLIGENHYDLHSY